MICLFESIAVVLYVVVLLTCVVLTQELMTLKNMCMLSHAFKTRLSMLLHILVNKNPFVTTRSITTTDYSLQFKRPCANSNIPNMHSE